MAGYLINNLISSEARAEMEALTSAVGRMREALTGLNNVNNITDDQFTELATRVNSLEQAIAKLAEAERRLAQERQRNSQQQRTQVTENANELAQLNEYYRQMERRQQITRAYRDEQRQLIATQKQQAAAERDQAAASAEYTKAQAAKIGQTSIELEQMNAYYRELERQSRLEEKRLKDTQQYRVDRKAQQETERLNAIVASEYTTELEKQDARIKLLNRELQSIIKLHGTENRLYIEKSKAMQSAIDEYVRMQQASGQLAMSQTKAYGATFSLTQIMRELPNFAIDARIGFMSLSNNIPMFVSDFERLSKSINAATGRALGWAGATRVMISSLLSLNTIAVIVATLFVAFGDQLGNLFKRQVDSATEGIRNFYKELKKGSGDVAEAVKEMLQLTSVMDAARKGFISKSDAVQEYNKVLENVTGRAKDFETAEKNLVDITPAYIEAIAKRAYAQSILEKAVGAYTSAMERQQNQEISFWQRVGAILQIPILTDGQTLDEWILGRRRGQARKDLDSFREGLTAFQSAYEDFAKFSSENGLDFWGDDLKKGSGGNTVIQQGQAMLRQLQTFSEERIRLAEQIRDKELQASRETVTGELQDFEERARAAQELYDLQARLAEIDLADAIANADEKMRVDTLRLNDTRQKNQRLYSEGKITYARYTELEKQWAEASKAIAQERSIAVLKAQDDWSATSLRNYQGFFSEFLSIQREMTERQAQEIDLGANSQLAALDRAYMQAQAFIEDENRSSILSALGLSTPSTESRNIALQRQYNQDRYNVQLDAINQQLAIVRKGSEDERNLLDEQRRLTQERDQQYAKDSIELKRAEVKMRQDLEVEAAKQTVALINAIWDSYYAMQLQKIDEQREKLSAMEDERMKDIEDREKAGVITAQEAEEERLRMRDYYQGMQDELDRQQRQKEREQFLLQQAAALAQVWVNWAIATSNPGNLLALGAMTPLYTAIAALASATILAQSIPYFAEGGTMDKDGVALLGDGGKKELGITPSGKMFITPDTPTLYNLEAGTKILPDADKIDIDSILRSPVQLSVYKEDDERMLREIKGLRDDMRRKKNPGHASLLRQMEWAKRMNGRRSRL